MPNIITLSLKFLYPISFFSKKVRKKWNEIRVSRHLYIKDMKNSKTQMWLEANKICLAAGDSVALNLMFETKKDHERFLKYWDKYLGGMTEIINYHLSPTGWTILFKTKSANTIQNAYLLQRKKSKKAISKNVLVDVGKILSEHFRIFLSQYVRRTNASHRRSGTLVKQSFSKYILNH